MGNRPTEDIQVANETVEFYRGITIFRTLERGTIAFKGGETKKSYPAQTFYALAQKAAMPGAFEDNKGEERALVGSDVENVRALIDRYNPGTGIINAPVTGSENV